MRVSISKVRAIINNINKFNGTDFNLSHRYDYYAIDRNRESRTCITGTLRECYIFITGVWHGLYQFENLEK